MEIHPRAQKCCREATIIFQNDWNGRRAIAAADTIALSCLRGIFGAGRRTRGTGVSLMQNMKSLSTKSALVAVALMAGAGVANAEDREFGWSMTVGATSDYVFRGISLSDEKPAAQGSLDMTYGIFYAGAWASNVSDYTDQNLYGPWELDLYAGITPTWGQVSFDFGVVGYLYPGADDSGDYVEFKAGAKTELLKDLSGGVTFWYTPDQQNYVETWTVEGVLAYTLPTWGMFEPSLSGLVGYSSADDGSAVASCGVPCENDYVYWNAGLSLTVEKFTMDFRYWDTNISDSANNDSGNFFAGEGLADERFVFSAKVVLP
jgi:uncharacterized protein (TIGR02001 family)